MNERKKAPTSQTVFRKHFREVLAMCGASYVSHANILLDQFFVGSIGAGFLNFHIFVASLGLFAFTLGRALGNAVLVTSGKESSDHFIGAGMTSSLFMAVAASLIMLALQERFLVWSVIPKTWARSYFYIFLAIYICDILKSVASAAMVRLGIHRAFIPLSILSIVVNLVGSATVFLVTDDPGHRFLGVGLSTFVAALLPLLLSFYLIRRRASLRWGIDLTQMKRIFRSFRGESAYLLTLGFLPLVVLAMLQRFYGPDLVNVYGVAQRICAFLMAPWFVSVTLTVRNATGVSSGAIGESAFLAAGERTGWLLAGIPLLGAGFVMPFLFASHGWQALILAAALPARQLFQVMTLSEIVKGRVREMTERSALVEIVWSGIVCCFLLWLGSKLNAPLLGLGGAFLISGAGLFWSLRWFNERPIELFWKRLASHGPKPVSVRECDRWR